MRSITSLLVGPQHGAAGATSRHTRQLGWALVLNGSFFLVEVAAGIWTGSLALLADAAHMLADAAGVALALFAEWVAAKPPTREKSYGYYRVEILAAFVNAVVLLLISVLILYEAYRRLRSEPEVLAAPMLLVAAIGLAVNAAGVWLLRGGASKSLNVQGAYLDMLADTLGSLGVMLGAVVILVTGWRLADPVVAAGIGLLIVPRTWGLLRQAVDVLLEATPAHIDLDEVERMMAAIPGVRQVHDLHVWTLTSGKYAMSGHALVEDLAASERILRDLHTLLHVGFAIDHTTIQLEPPPLVQITTRQPDPPPQRIQGDSR